MRRRRRPRRQMQNPQLRGYAMDSKTRGPYQRKAFELGFRRCACAVPCRPGVSQPTPCIAARNRKTREMAAIASRRNGLHGALSTREQFAKHPKAAPAPALELTTPAPPPPPPPPGPGAPVCALAARLADATMSEAEEEMETEVDEEEEEEELSDDEGGFLEAQHDALQLLREEEAQGAPQVGMVVRGGLAANRSLARV